MSVFAPVSDFSLMRHKTKKPPPIANPDVTNESPAYWNEVLKSHGLSMGKGNKVSVAYVGKAEDVEHLVDYEEPMIGGHKVRPRGHGPEE